MVKSSAGTYLDKQLRLALLLLIRVPFDTSYYKRPLYILCRLYSMHGDATTLAYQQRF
jgi:hypothetical protein